MLILAGDVGGTKCNLALFVQEGSGLRPVFQRRLATRDYTGFDDMIAEFFKQAAAANVNVANVKVNEQTIDAAGFGVAGVVIDGRHYSENLPWLVDVSALTQKLNIRNVSLLNDLTATALSLEKLSASDVAPLNIGSPVENATRAVIAVGTGLGEALLFWDGQKSRVASAEGGQADFAPRTDREINLLRHLRTHSPRVSCEEIVSGRGFRKIHEFLDPALRHDSFDSPNGNASSEITQRGLAQSCSICVETLAFWIELFGGVTGNFALQTMALGGISIAGGIAVKILPKLHDGSFFKAFCGTSKLAPLLASIPIAVVVNEDAPMLGAAYHAMTLS
jgi:glucokinase